MDALIVRGFAHRTLGRRFGVSPTVHSAWLRGFAHRNRSGCRGFAHRGAFAEALGHPRAEFCPLVGTPDRQSAHLAGTLRPQRPGSVGVSPTGGSSGRVRCFAHRSSLWTARDFTHAPRGGTPTRPSGEQTPIHGGSPTRGFDKPRENMGFSTLPGHLTYLTLYITLSLTAQLRRRRETQGQKRGPVSPARGLRPRPGKPEKSHRPPISPELPKLWAW